MAGTALRGRLTWRVATVSAVRDETPTARTLVLDVPDWPGHLAGQHVDVRLTAPDGYRATRSYSIASARPPTAADASGAQVELTVEQVPDGEVSPYLGQVIGVGDPLEIRGPVGGWFVWRPEQPGPIQLIGGGSGMVPLMAILRASELAGRQPDVRLLYSARRPESVLYAGELAKSKSEIAFAYTREGPAGERIGRIDAELLARSAWSPGVGATVYVCGPTPFVETVADLLVAAGHDPAQVRTERFGPSGGGR